jgi:ribose/xylose/arabinose/galactoside ABC-type transport system permease subunit
VTILFTGGTVVMIEFDSGLKQIFGLSPWMLIVAAFAAVIAWVAQKYTIFGRYMYMIGGDETVARLSGINVRQMKVLIYTVCGAFTALGGIMIAARIGSGSPATGQGYELDVISAVVLGGTSMRGGIGGVRGTILGALTLAMLNNGLVLLGVASDVQLLVKGIVLILAVYVSLEHKKDEVVK